VVIQSPTNFSRVASGRPVFQEHHRVRALDRDLAELARLARTAFAVDHRHGVAGDGLADGARPRDADRGAGADHQVALGLAVEFVDRDAERRLAPFVGLGAQRLAAGADRAQVDGVTPARVRHRPQHA
jgi:hypothetical protein